jgi:PEGA domain
MTTSRSRLRRSFAASLLVVLFADSAALAQPPAPPTPPAALGDALTGQAKDDYESGRILFDNGDNAGALVKFQHAFDLSSDSRLLWDMGACEKNLRHYVHVLRLVERYLHDGQTSITEAQRAEAAAVVRTVRSLVSSVRLIVNEAGASVFVDDEPVGTTPLMEGVLVDLGERRIRVSKPGFKEQVITQHVAGASDLTVSVVLEREVSMGRLVVSTDAAGAISVDGAPAGVGRWEGPVSAGSHAIRVTAPGMVAYSADVAVKDGETRSLDIGLQRQSGGISPAWWIGGGLLAAAGLGVGGYFLFRPSSQTTGPATQGTISPGTLTILTAR